MIEIRENIEISYMLKICGKLPHNAEFTAGGQASRRFRCHAINATVQPMLHQRAGITDGAASFRHTAAAQCAIAEESRQRKRKDSAAEM